MESMYNSNLISRHDNHFGPTRMPRGREFSNYSLPCGRHAVLLRFLEVVFDSEKKYIYQQAHDGNDETAINELWYKARDFVAFKEAFLDDTRVVAKEARAKAPIDRALHQFMKFSWRNLDVEFNQAESQEYKSFSASRLIAAFLDSSQRGFIVKKATSKKNVVYEVLR